jgi:hypothetical protein
MLCGAFHSASRRIDFVSLIEGLSFCRELAETNVITRGAKVRPGVRLRACFGGRPTVQPTASGSLRRRFGEIIPRAGGITSINASRVG